MDDLVPWLLEQVAEDERLAKACTPGPWRWGDWSTTFGDQETQRRTLEYAPALGQFPAVVTRDHEHQLVLPSLEDPIEIGGYDEEPLGENADHIVRWAPDRALAECATKRSLIEFWSKAYRWPKDFPGPDWDRVRGNARWTLKKLALPYAGRPGYREEWRP